MWGSSGVVLLSTQQCRSQNWPLVQVCHPKSAWPTRPSARVGGVALFWPGPWQLETRHISRICVSMNNCPWRVEYAEYPAPSPGVLSRASCMNTASWNIYNCTCSIRHCFLKSWALPSGKPGTTPWSHQPNRCPQSSVLPPGVLRALPRVLMAVCLEHRALLTWRSKHFSPEPSLPETWAGPPHAKDRVMDHGF